MITDNANKPANPTLTYEPSSGSPNGHFMGLTKREYFAAMAMQGILSANAQYFHGNIPVPVSSNVAKCSIEFADELLKQLEQ